MTETENLHWGEAHWKQVRHLFHQALELPPEERAAFLGRHCRDDDTLRHQVEHLIAADARSKSEGFLEPPIEPLLSKEPKKGRQNDLKPGHLVGPFRIKDRIGAGNMGEVYRAERDDDFKMVVALKVIDASKVDDEMIWRFKHERQILAWLEHPNIARIIDGGTLDDGRPWFALEHIEGQRIDRYCNHHRLTVRQRIELFRKVCAAVSEAHDLAVVHRDLKPANLLVTSEGEPKLLDFGIAKIDDGSPVSSQASDLDSLEDASSGLNDNPLTPLYASPEQATPRLDPKSSEHPAIGVRSDIYTLGVLLYELLTGHPPYRNIRPWPVLLQSVVDEIPRLPSEVVGVNLPKRSRKSQQSTPILAAAQRHTTPRALRHQLKGDLDAIICHALEKKPADRYASVALFDADLRAYLEGYPVMPRKANKLYSARRFLKRNLLAVVAATAAVLILMTYVVMNLRAQDQVLETRKFLFELTQIQIEDLSDEDFAQQLRDTVYDYGDKVWLADNLEELGLDLEERGHLRGAMALYEENLDMRRRLLEPNHPDLAVAYNNLAGAQLQLGRFEIAESNYLRDLEIREERHGKNSIEVSRTLNNLAALYQHWGGQYLAKATPLLERSLRIRESTVKAKKQQGEDTFGAEIQVLATRNNLATQFLLEHRIAEAKPIYEDVLKGLDSMPASARSQRHRAGVLRNLALVHLGLGDAKTAETHAREALTLFRQGSVHWRIADAESVLGACWATQGRIEEARFFLEQSIEDLRTSQAAESRHAREAEERKIHWLGS